MTADVDIIKTWPAFIEARKVAQIFSREGAFGRYYFTLGRGKPQKSLRRIWFTWHGRILGSFAIKTVVCNDGTLPPLRSLSGEISEWQIRPDAWVAVCVPGCERLRERVYMSSFRGWRYFDFEEYKNSPDARIRL